MANTAHIYVLRERRETMTREQYLYSKFLTIAAVLKIN